MPSGPFTPAEPPTDPRGGFEFHPEDHAIQSEQADFQFVSGGEIGTCYYPNRSTSNYD